MLLLSPLLNGWLTLSAFACIPYHTFFSYVLLSCVIHTHRILWYLYLFVFRVTGAFCLLCYKHSVSHYITWFFLSQIIWIVFIKDHQSKYHDVMFTRFDENWSIIFLWMQLTQIRVILAIWNNADNFFYCRDWKYGIERGPRAFCGFCLLCSNCSCQDAFHVLPHSQVCFAILLLNFLRC